MSSCAFVMLRLMRNEEIVSYGVTFLPTCVTENRPRGKFFSNSDSLWLDSKQAPYTNFCSHLRVRVSTHYKFQGQRLVTSAMLCQPHSSLFVVTFQSQPVGACLTLECTALPTCLHAPGAYVSFPINSCVSLHQSVSAVIMGCFDGISSSYTLCTDFQR